MPQSRAQRGEAANLTMSRLGSIVCRMKIGSEELIRSLQKKERRLTVMTGPGEEVSASAIEFAKSQGYKISSKRGSDASDPGGCMSLCTIHEFSLY